MMPSRFEGKYVFLLMLMLIGRKTVVIRAEQRKSAERTKTETEDKTDRRSLRSLED